MTKQFFRWISCGTLLLALWSACSCATNSKTSTAPSLTFSASPSSIGAGQSVTLSWQTTNSTSVTITAAAGSTMRALTTSSQATGTVKDSPTQTTIYTAVATGPGGTSSPQTANVTVAPPASPQITQFTANPTSIGSGQSVTLSWQTTNSTSVTITAAAGSTMRALTTSSQATGTVQDSPTQTTIY